ncbi:MAG: hypothetical protein E7I47_12490 [Clostridium sp.]|uniref:hypothetical protein n=1 Tax=Clostridium sp. TaxID=1506 RepID=UPI00290B1F48|nr:hypothetical protein [Clostridium sp.]MDU4320117.1 hypothetical protein [Clostridium sp.]
MKYEEKVKLIESIIENEFQHVQEYEEIKFIDNDVEQKELTATRQKAYEEVRKIDTENKHWKELDNFDCAYVDEWINLCRFYFKQGVAAGLTNLKFLNDINAGQVLR